MKNLLKRLREPSTFSSLGVVLALAGVSLPAGAMEALAQTGAGLAALAGIFMPEAGAGGN